MQTAADGLKVNPKFARKIKIDIMNSASFGNKKYLCLLQDARVVCKAPYKQDVEFGRVYTSGLIWFPNQLVRIIWAGGASKAEGGPLTCDFYGLIKLRVYQLVGNRNASDPKTVESLVYLNHTTGKLDLKSEGAKALEDVFIKVENPNGMSYNAITTVALAPEDACGNLPSDGSLHKEGLADELQKKGRRTAQNEVNVFNSSYYTFTQTISGGSKECNGTVSMLSRFL